MTHPKLSNFLSLIISLYCFIAYQVIDVTVKAQSDNSNLAIVRVPTTDDARFAISQFHGKKIGYKRVHVCLKSDGNLNQSSLR